MSSRKNVLLIAAAVLIMALGYGAARKIFTPKDTLELPFTESELNALESQIEELEFDDLEGLTTEGASLVSFSSEDLDKLGEILEDLEFEDLEGLTSP